MLNLKENEELNTLTQKEKDGMWMPYVVFFNTQKKLETISDSAAYAFVKRKGKYLRNDQTEVINTYLFKGSENPIVLTRVYSMEFLCNFDMSIYPFDNQTCSAIFVMKGNTGNFVKLVADSVKYLGPKDLQEYSVHETNIFEKQLLTSSFHQVEMVIVFQRRVLSALLSNYFPTFLICLIAYSTNYYDPFYFEAIVTVNLTSLLCLTTIFINVSTSLPTTSYIKMIDIWFIFCMMFPFFEVILHVCEIGVFNIGLLTR